MKSPRNKTITLTDEERNSLKNKLTYVDKSYTDIENKIICGDTIKTAELLPRKFVDLMIADPPYNLYKNYNGNKFNEVSEQEYVKYTEQWINAVLPLLKDDASVYVCCDWRSSQAVYSVLSKHLNIQNRITWQREKGRGASKNWKNGMEDIWFATVSKDYYFDVEAVKIKRKVIAPYKQDGEAKDWSQEDDGKFRLTYPSNFWDDISIPYWSMPENTEHPTQKPEKLIAKLILASSKAGDMVFDPFLGSGTTAVTAKKLDRKFCGIEQNPEYCMIGHKRLELAETNNQIQGYNGVFWERNTAVKNLKK